MDDRINYLIFGRYLETANQIDDAVIAYEHFIKTHSFYFYYVDLKGREFVEEEIKQLKRIEDFCHYEAFLNQLKQFAEHNEINKLSDIDFNIWKSSFN